MRVYSASWNKLGYPAIFSIGMSGTLGLNVLNNWLNRELIRKYEPLHTFGERVRQSYFGRFSSDMP